MAYVLGLNETEELFVDITMGAMDDEEEENDDEDIDSDSEEEELE